MADNPPVLSLSPTALTSLSAVKAWSGGTNAGPLTPAQQSWYVSLINSASTLILSLTSRDNLLYRTVTETRTGYNTPSITLINWPVLEVLSLSLNGVAQSSQTVFGNTGFKLDPWDGGVPGKPQRLYAIGSCFSNTPGGIVVSYTTGYVVQGEAQTVDPAGDGTIWPIGPLGRYAANWKVLDAGGATMVAVASGPSVGQYVAPANDEVPYQFNAAQGVVNLYYSFRPADLDYATAKWVGEWISYRGRIGQNSRSVGGQMTESFRNEAMPLDVKLIINQYNRVLTL